MQISQQKFCN